MDVAQGNLLKRDHSFQWVYSGGEGSDPQLGSPPSLSFGKIHIKINIFIDIKART